MNFSPTGLRLILAVLIVVVCAPHAHADAITPFDVSGTATNASGGFLGSCAPNAICSFSGTLTLDVTNGGITAVDLTIPGVNSFFNVLASDTLVVDSIATSNWILVVANTSSNMLATGDSLVFAFTTTTTPSTLEGFTGGVTFEGSVLPSVVAPVPTPQDTIVGGSITPAQTPIPEPSCCLLLLAGGLTSLLGLTRKRIA